MRSLACGHRLPAVQDAAPGVRAQESAGDRARLPELRREVPGAVPALLSMQGGARLGGQPVTIMRVRYQKLGGHYHCRVFTAKGQDQTFAKCGDLVFDEQEFDEVKRMLAIGGAEVIEEEA